MAKKDSYTEEMSQVDGVETFVLTDDGVFPNSDLPLIVYRGVFDRHGPDAESHARDLLARHHWTGGWVNGIYGFHHYHSTSHEVLVITVGQAKVQFGGEHGITAEVTAGDAVVIPAGVAHKNLGSSADFTVVGAYPDGRSYDMCYGKQGERPMTDRNIAQVPLTHIDPLVGPNGPLIQLWT